MRRVAVLFYSGFRVLGLGVWVYCLIQGLGSRVCGMWMCLFNSGFRV